MTNVKVRVQDGDVAKALKRLKKKVEREHLLIEAKRHDYFLKPSQKRRQDERRSVRRRKKAARE